MRLTNDEASCMRSAGRYGMGSGTEATNASAAKPMVAAAPTTMGPSHHQLAWLAASAESSRLASCGSRK
jgi:hypothetical protein